VWQHKSEERPTLGQTKHGPSLHVYMGVTKYGTTRLIRVTGGSTKNTRFFGKNKMLLRGVGAEEYRQVVLPALLDDGQRLFAAAGKRGWILQQDGARIHQPDLCRDYARGRAPGGLLEPWPANSPDLSWIENIWAWMSAELQRKSRCTTADQLWVALNEIWSSISVDMLVPYVEGMPTRLQRCIELSGAAVK
jgi:DDE superfamily endonuclease